MGWCNDIKSTQFYNKLIINNKNLKHENFIDTISNIIFLYQ